MKNLKITAPTGYEIEKGKEMSSFLFSMLGKTIMEFDYMPLLDEKYIYLYHPKSHELLAQIFLERKSLLLNYLLIWSVFENRFGLEHDQIVDFISGWVKSNIGWKGMAPCYLVLESNI
jgi:hypothetical protein